MKPVERQHRLAAAMAYEGAIFEAELCAYQRQFVDGEAQTHEKHGNLQPTLEILERIAQAIADADAP